MNQCNENCIYCAELFDSQRGAGDHIIPASLGEFRNDVRFRRICPTCNNHIGKSEQQFLQCGPEGFLRRVVRPNVVRRRKDTQPRAVGSMGMPPPTHLVRIDDHFQLARPDERNPENANPVDQVVVRTRDGDEHYFPLFRGMNPEQLLARCTASCIGEISTVWLHCDEGRWDEYSKLVRAAWTNKSLTVLPCTEVGNQRVKGRTTFTFGDHYFRAIVKIAFHYYLVHSQRRTRGDEPEFREIRQFIMEGGDFAPFFSADMRFAVPFGGPWRPSQWCHVLAADESSDYCVSYVHLFAGPGASRKPHHVILGKVPGRVILPQGVSSHVYKYDNDQGAGRFAGTVESVTPRRIR